MHLNVESEMKSKKINTSNSSVLGESGILKLVGSPPGRSERSTNNPSEYVREKPPAVEINSLTSRRVNKSAILSSRVGMNNELDSSIYLTASRSYLEEKENIPDILIFDVEESPIAKSFSSFNSESSSKGILGRVCLSLNIC